MFRSPSQQRQLMMMNGGNRPLPPAPPGVNPRPPMQQPIPNRLQQQLNQHKIQKQAHIAGPVKKPLPKPVEEQEEKIEVLTSWWAWTAYLMTCCIPNWFLRVCLRKKNPMVQQAWREKVNKYRM
jgi:chitin synthase